MELTLSTTEKELLLEILAEHHRELLREIAKAKHREFRQDLKSKEALLESIVNKVELLQPVEVVLQSA
jgi:hypothetical protein